MKTNNYARREPKEICAHPVIKKQAHGSDRKEKSKRDDENRIPSVLPHDDFVIVQVTNVCEAGFTFSLEEYPAHV